MGSRRRGSTGLVEPVAPTRNRRSALKPVGKVVKCRIKTSEPSPSSKRRRNHLKTPPLKRKLSWIGWSAVGIPLAALTFLVAIAPPSTRRTQAPLSSVSAPSESFQYLPDRDVFALNFDPRKVSFGMLEGWDREQEAYNDNRALAFVSGPMYERYNDNGQEVTIPLGDIKLGNQIWRGRNRSAAKQRAFMGITHQGRVDFGYGELTDARAGEYETFIGGLHSLYNDMQSPPSSYKGAYSVSMGQQIRYFLPRVRMVLGLRSDGRLEVFMSRDGLTLEQTKEIARSRGLVAAYMPDHASKSRFIIPGVKGFSEDDANWISGGATSFVHVPYMLKLEPRPFHLQGSLLANLNPLGKGSDCTNPLDCGVKLGGQVMDRAMAGLNRLMEKGVVPIARLFWSPSKTPTPTRPTNAAPMREPPITADPTLALKGTPPPRAPELPGSGVGLAEPVSPAPLAPDLPAPETYGSSQTSTHNQAVYDPNLSITAGSETRLVPAPPVLPPASPPTP
jgi:hypothetical protein